MTLEVFPTIGVERLAIVAEVPIGFARSAEARFRGNVTTFAVK